MWYVFGGIRAENSCLSLHDKICLDMWLVSFLMCCGVLAVGKVLAAGGGPMLLCLRAFSQQRTSFIDE